MLTVFLYRKKKEKHILLSYDSNIKWCCNDSTCVYVLLIYARSAVVVDPVDLSTDEHADLTVLPLLFIGDEIRDQQSQTWHRRGHHITHYTWSSRRGSASVQRTQRHNVYMLRYTSQKCNNEVSVFPAASRRPRVSLLLTRDYSRCVSVSRSYCDCLPPVNCSFLKDCFTGASANMVYGSLIKHEKHSLNTF